MADNAMARLAFFITVFLFTFSVLLVILVVQKIIQSILRKRLRTLISEDSQHDLVGREAVVTRTVRQNKAGRIQLEYLGSNLLFKAISDHKQYVGTIVQITAVTPQGFRVSRVYQDHDDANRLGDETDPTLKKTVVQDINVEQRS